MHDGQRRAGIARLYAAIAGMLLMLSACVSTPQGTQPVRDFDVHRYLGKWYEIARLDHSFERGLESVTAEYSMREDGGVRVVNRGYSPKDGQWREAEGRAYFVQSPDIGHLKVSFFGPFYGAYVVFELDRENYNYSFVCGPDRSYLWLLARTPQVSDAVIERFKLRAAELGFDLSKLHMVRHIR